MMASIRQRTNIAGKKDVELELSKSFKQKSEERSVEVGASLSSDGQTFCVTKQVILRALGVLFAIAFKVAADQNLALIGSNGLTPVGEKFEHIKRHTGSMEGFLKAPTIFWFVPITDQALQAVANLGIICGILQASGIFSSLLCAASWLLYFSIVTIAEGTSWYSYGWESQLLETGFLAIFLCAPFDIRAVPSLPVLWLFRWLMFRISTGAGLIKVRGSSCWVQRTCLWYHFETQPIPSPVSFVWHFLPRHLLSLGVDIDIFVQLYAIWFVLTPGFGILRQVRRMAGLIQIVFMLNIAISGNLSFLNHLTIIPALACLDDAFWKSVLRAWPFKIKSSQSTERTYTSVCRRIIDFVLVLTIAYLSEPVVRNLLQLEGRQVMNRSFGSFRLVNTYGAFGNVGQARYEPIVSVSHDGRNWHELEFPCKPGRVDRRPCLCAPYHYRLDWNIWFIGFKPHKNYLIRREKWMWPFIAKVLEGDQVALSLLAWETSTSNAFHLNGSYTLPKLVKVDMWRYRMRAPLWDILRDYYANGTSIWWAREYEEPLIAPVHRKSTLLMQMMKEQ